MQVCPGCGEENPPKFRLCGYCGTALSAPVVAQEVRKTVTVVFSDLQGSTSLGERLDSESLREVMSRYFDTVAGILESHGGTIEKFIGDAVMAVFGLPKLHEDDALRAVRAVDEIKRQLIPLNEELDRRWGVTLVARTGVNTGEVVAGDPAAGQRLVTGDVVNVAARLEQAAPPMEALLGELTHRLVRDSVQAEPVEPLELKGKAERVPAYQLVAILDEPLAARHQRPLVGRREEIAELTDALDEAIRTRGSRLVTVLGQPGVGKSRLVAEFLQRVGDQARVVRGRCLPYGRGITFWPLVEIVRDAAAIGDDDPPDVARAKLARLADGATGGDGAAIVDRVAAVVGLADGQFPLEETFWGVRKLVEHGARARPLVILLDDIQWGEMTLLDLIEHLARSGDAPVLILCAARPELQEIREGWGEWEGSRTIQLGPLSAAETERILDSVLGHGEMAEDLRRRIIADCDGNPLFVEQMISMMIDDGILREEDGRWIATRELTGVAVPPTLQALVAARLDGLRVEERAVLEPAAVVGLAFAEAAVRELAPEPVRADVPRHLVSLERKQLVQSEAVATGAGEDVFRFHHILIRDVAYHGLLKRARATLHERFVRWSQSSPRYLEGGELEEVLGYHLEQAYGYLAELGPLDDHGRRLGSEAGQQLGNAGRRALARGDMPAAANLLRRAVGVLDEDDPFRLSLLPELGEALTEIGEFAWAELFLDQARDGAAARGDSRLHARATLMRVLSKAQSDGSEYWTQEVAREAQRVLPLFEAAEDHAGRATALRLLAWAHGTAGRYGQAADAAQLAVEHAALAGDDRQLRRASSQYATAALYGPTPVEDAIAHCEALVERVSGDRRSEGLVKSLLARLEAMRGEFERGRELYETARLTLEEMGRSVVAASTSLDSCGVELLAGDPARAEQELRRDYEALETMGEQYLLSTVAGELARAVHLQGRIDEADRFTRRAEELAAADDVTSQALWRSVRARVLADRGERAEAIALASEAVELLRQTDAAVTQADALVDLGHVLRNGGQREAARAALEEALQLFERKGNVVSARATRALMQSVDGAAQTAP